MQPVYSYQPAVQTNYVYQPFVQPVQKASRPKKAAPPAIKLAQAQAELLMNVPEDADVYLVGTKMKSTGTQRLYRIPLKSTSKSYTYQIRVVVTRNGEKLVNETQRTVRAGQKLELSVAAADLKSETTLAAK